MSVRDAAARAGRRGVRVAARALDRVAPPASGVVVLSYHQVGAARPGPVNTPVAAFDEQVAMLAGQRVAGRPVSLDQAVDALGASPTPVDLLAVTFDDGTADFVEHALPVLVRHQVPVTLYVATAFVEEQRSFWDDGTVLSWAALRDALTTGLVTVGTHTHRHTLLDRADPAVVADELDRSIGLVHDRLGVGAMHFAYPKAVAPPAGSPAEAAVRARVRSAAVAGGRVNRWGRTDPWRLHRSPVVAADDLDAVGRKARGGLRLEGAARDALDRVRYAGATT